jgi:HSP20 family protein
MKNLMRWDPFRMIRSFDPFDELRTMQREMDRLFDRVLGTEAAGEAEQRVLYPSIESYRKDGRLVIKAELPGIDPGDLDVSVTERELVIKGERKTEKDETKKDFTYREISYGSFERRLVLPEGAKTEDLKATFTNGILEISVPVPELPRAKKIEIETRAGKELPSEPKVKKAA